MNVLENYRVNKKNRKKYDCLLWDGFEKHINDYDNKNIILIIRDCHNYILDIQKIKYDKLLFNDIKSFSEYASKEFVDDISVLHCDYDIDCKKKYLFYVSKKNNKLNLDINFDYLKFNDYFNETGKDLVINSIITTGGLGGAGGPGLFAIVSFLFMIRDIIVYIYNALVKMFSYLFPFTIIKRKYKYGRIFLYDIIKNSDTWDYGFMDLKKLKFRKYIERSIMKKFGYIKQNDLWICKETRVYTKELLNRYNYY